MLTGTERLDMYLEHLRKEKFVVVYEREALDDVLSFLIEFGQDFSMHPRLEGGLHWRVTLN